MGYDYGMDVGFLKGNGGLVLARTRLWMYKNQDKVVITSAGDRANPQLTYHIYILSH